MVVGADRVVANGDTANKIGTYALSIIAAHHKVRREEGAGGEGGLPVDRAHRRSAIQEEWGSTCSILHVCPAVRHCSPPQGMEGAGGSRAAGGRDKPSKAYRQRMADRGEGEHVWPPLTILYFPSALFSLILSLPSAPSP